MKRDIWYRTKERCWIAAYLMPLTHWVIRLSLETARGPVSENMFLCVWDGGIVFKRAQHFCTDVLVRTSQRVKREENTDVRWKKTDVNKTKRSIRITFETIKLFKNNEMTLVTIDINIWTNDTGKSLGRNAQNYPTNFFHSGFEVMWWKSAHKEWHHSKRSGFFQTWCFLKKTQKNSFLNDITFGQKANHMGNMC